MTHQKSQFSEDLLLLPTLMLPFPESSKTFQHGGLINRARHRRGSFVEIGAFDGVNKSNTFAFERCCGWLGALIEANPSNFEALQRSGRRSSMIHSGVCPSPGRFNMSSEGGLFAAAVVNGQHASRIELRRKKVSVSCDTLERLLDSGMPDEVRGREIDFLSLDVEGLEEMVLSTIDPTRFKVIVMESQKLKRSALDRIRRRMAQRGMLEVPGLRVHNSKVFAHANFSVVVVPNVRYWPPPPKMPDEAGLADGLRKALHKITSYSRSSEGPSITFTIRSL